MLYRSSLLRFFMTSLISGTAAQSYGLESPALVASSQPDSVAAYDFRGIVALNNCSASLVRFDVSQGDDKALVMTNGHCVSLLADGVVLQNQAAVRDMNLLGRGAETIASLESEKLVYATMTKTDLALYQLPLTYDEIERDHGITALELARVGAQVGEGIEILSGYWRRGYACHIDAVIPKLHEYQWHWQDALRYSRSGCNTIGGTSGSPLLSKESGLIVGINNTNNRDGGACTLHNPCEEDETGARYQEKGLSYGQQTAWLYSCLGDDRQLDLSLDTCLLPHP